jgi:hypothetical protein
MTEIENRPRRFETSPKVRTPGSLALHQIPETNIAWIISPPTKQDLSGLKSGSIGILMQKMFTSNSHHDVSCALSSSHSIMVAMAVSIV